MKRAARAMLAKGRIRFPLSVVAAILLFNAVSRAASDGVIPPWAQAVTDSNRCGGP